MGYTVAALLLVLAAGLCGYVTSEKPAVVNVGAALAYNSVIGRVAKVAIEAAVADVNADGEVLAGTRLNLIMRDSNCNPFLGSIGVLKALEEDVVAIIGPQSSVTAHMISAICEGLQIPLVSFAATDPTLSSSQFPFFVRTTQSDSYQMMTMANLIGHFGWRQVIAIFVDDDYGRNGVASLDDELTKRMSKVYKVALPVKPSIDKIRSLLQMSQTIGPRVYVVHAAPDSGLDILAVAQQLHMMTDGYAWLTTDWLSTALETAILVNDMPLTYLQGVVGFRQYIPRSSQKDSFTSRWNRLYERGVITSNLSTYGFRAYDTVWVVAHAIDDFLKQSQNITFSSYNNLNMRGTLQQEMLKTFDGGQRLLKMLLNQNFTGLSGQIQFDSAQELVSSTYEIFNVYGSLINRVGYWSSEFGLSVSAPYHLHSNRQKNSSLSQVLGNITWPGGKTETPRGWVVATKERPLRIGVPYRVSYIDFVTIKKDGGRINVSGYCIDVFKAATALIPYEVPYQFVPFGNMKKNPDYDSFVNQIVEDVIDAAIGDIAIVTNRTRIADFTQPYISAGLVILTPLKHIESNAWTFLRPFSITMWCMIGAFFFLIGVVVWLLEHRVNSAFRGSPKRQCRTIFLFAFSTLSRSYQEETLSALGRFVMMVWFFVLLVISSSYTASLSSFLTAQQLSSPVTGIDSLIACNQPIGFQIGSFVQGYLRETLNIHQSRLVSLDSPEAYEEALRRGPKDGGVVAIVDELPYIELFLEKASGFGIVGEPFTGDGWGFAFPRDSSLAIDMSTAILKLSENGDLQKIHKKWFCKTGCYTQATISSESNQLHLRCFWGLLTIFSIITVFSLVLFLLRAISQFIHLSRNQRDSPSTSSESRNRSCCEAIYKFIEFIDQKEEAVNNMIKPPNPSPGST